MRLLAQRHFWLQKKKNKMATIKIQTQGFKMAVHTPMGDITDAIIVLYTYTMLYAHYIYSLWQQSKLKNVLSYHSISQYVKKYNLVC